MEFSRNVSTSSANGLQWLRSQQKNGQWVDTHTSSGVIQSLIKVYVNDGGRCWKTLNDSINLIDNSKVTDLPGGKLSQVMIGLRASCKDVRRYKKNDLIRALKAKMETFPTDEFNRFYEYSIGIIALYINGEDIPSPFGERLLQGVFIGERRRKKARKKKKQYHVTDTEALSLIALSAISKQKFTSHWVRKHTIREWKKARKKVDHILKTQTPENLVTFVHMLQVILHEVSTAQG